MEPSRFHLQRGRERLMTLGTVCHLLKLICFRIVAKFLTWSQLCHCHLSKYILPAGIHTAGSIKNKDGRNSHLRHLIGIDCTFPCDDLARCPQLENFAIHDRTHPEQSAKMKESLLSKKTKPDKKLEMESHLVAVMEKFAKPNHDTSGKDIQASNDGEQSDDEFDMKDPLLLRRFCGKQNGRKWKKRL